MAKKRAKRQKWKIGDVFAIPLEDKSFSLGQVVDHEMTNIISCAIYDIRHTKIDDFSFNDIILQESLIAIISTTIEQIDFSVWIVIDSAEVLFPKSSFPNEKFRNLGWIGAVTYDAAIVEEFCEAFYGLTAWDDWYDPLYFDKLLIHPSKKPKDLILVKS